MRRKKEAKLLEQEQMRMKAYADEHVQRREMVCLSVEDGLSVCAIQLLGAQVAT
jgi:hypothetical protein